jgi:hypothetical protein
MTTIEKITAKLDEIASRAGNRRDVPQLVDAMRDATKTIACLGSPMTPKQRSKLAEYILDRIARTLNA